MQRLHEISGHGAKYVLFLEPKCSLFQINVLFQEQIMICAWKSNIFDTFLVLDLNPNEKKNTFSKSVAILWPDSYCGLHCNNHQSPRINIV
jgi:hypothetical protein